MKHGILWGALILLLLPLAQADLTLTQASVHAPSIEQGAQITLTYSVAADRPLGRVTTDIYLPGGINHRQNTRVDKRTYQHTQSFELPRSYNAEEEMLVRVSAPDQQPLIARIPLQAPAQAQPQIDSDTAVAVLVDPVRDVVPGDSIYYRAQIINTANRPVTATIGLSDVSDWATWRVDPAPTIRLEAQESTQVYVYLEADDDASPGIKYFDVTARHDGNQESATVKLAVLKPLDQQFAYAPWIIGAALALLVAAIIFVVATYKKQHREDQGGEEDDDFITYY